MPKKAALPAKGELTLFMENVPTSLSRQQVIRWFDSMGFEDRFNFMYLPRDFQQGCNKGYLFINFMQAEHAREFIRLTHNTVPEGAQLRLLVSQSSTQGLEASMARWQRSCSRRIKNPEALPYVRPELLPAGPSSADAPAHHAGSAAHSPARPSLASGSGGYLSESTRFPSEGGASSNWEQQNPQVHRDPPPPRQRTGGDWNGVAQPYHSEAPAPSAVPSPALLPAGSHSGSYYSLPGGCYSERSLPSLPEGAPARCAQYLSEADNYSDRVVPDERYPNLRAASAYSPQATTSNHWRDSETTYDTRARYLPEVAAPAISHVRSESYGGPPARYYFNVDDMASSSKHVRGADMAYSTRAHYYSEAASLQHNGHETSWQTSAPGLSYRSVPTENHGSFTRSYKADTVHVLERFSL